MPFVGADDRATQHFPTPKVVNGVISLVLGKVVAESKGRLVYSDR
jgi:hypothetical protein